jgi:hypothetical protein
MGCLGMQKKDKEKKRKSKKRKRESGSGTDDSDSDDGSSGSEGGAGGFKPYEGPAPHPILDRKVRQAGLSCCCRGHQSDAGACATRLAETALGILSPECRCASPT